MHVFHIARPLHTSAMLYVVLTTVAQVVLATRGIWLSPCSKGLALPAVQPLSYMVRGKRGLFMDFLALKLTWDASY